MNWFLTLLVALLPFAAQAAWTDSTGKDVPDSESKQSAENFGAQLLITKDGNLFRQTWHTSRTPPKRATTDSTRAGEEVSALIIFHDCAPNAEGDCDVVADFTVEEPDGKINPAGGGPVWSEKPMRPSVMQLGRASVTLDFGSTDAIGDYKITAKVKDNVSGRSLSVMARLKVVK